jgi:hypothetical protein
MTLPPPAPPSWRPTRKVTAGALAAASWTLFCAVMLRVGVDMGAGVESAAGGLLTLLAAYWTPEGP